MVKLLIFDLDGTLVESNELHWITYSGACRTFKLKTDKKFFYSCLGMQTKDILRKNFPGISEELIDRITHKKWELFEKKISGIKGYPDVKKAVEALSKKYILAVASSTYRKFIELSLRKKGLRKYFRIIVGADDVKRAKPAPDMLLRVLSKTGISRSNAVYIGDMIHDYTGAKKAGIKFIHFTQGKAKTKRYRHEFKKFRELPKLIQQYF